MVMKEVKVEVKVEVPKGGECNYKGYILDNGMKVMLITSPNFVTCGAALNIPAGYMHAPPHIPGLPHLLEHVVAREMLILDGKTGIGNILDEHGVLQAAITYSDFTTYYYRTNIKKLQSSLSFFKKMIFTPVFNELSIAREIELLNSEYIIISKDIQQILWEFEYAKWDVKKLEGKCTPGNKITLQIRPMENGINVRDELKRFHERYYTTNFMSLCVFAKDDMDNLKRKVDRIFSNIPKKNVHLSRRHIPMGFSNYRTKWFLVPRNHDKLLLIFLPLAFAYENCGCKPVKYIIRVLEDQRSGSLLSSLKMRCLATSLECNIYRSWESHMYLYVQFVLTEEGLDHIDGIICLLFEYINTLRQGSPKRELYVDYGKTPNTFSPPSAHYIEDEFSVISQNMSVFPKSLRNLFYDTGFHENHILFTIKRILRPDDIVACVVAREYEGETNEVTPWSQGKFKFDRIKDDIILKWSRIRNIEFLYPRKSSFQWNLKPTDTSNIIPEKGYDHPTPILKTNMLKCWFSSGREKPFEMFFQFTSEVAYSDIKGCNLNGIFALLLQDYVTEEVYSARLDHITCRLQSNKYGISLHIKNYQYKEEILTKILTAIINAMLKPDFSITDNTFGMLKEKYITNLKNLKDKAPDEQALHWLEVILTQRIWSHEELLENVGNLNVGGIRQYRRSFLKSMFVEYLIRGNIKKSVATQVSTILKSSFRGYALQKRKNFVLADDIILDKGYYFLYERGTIFHECSCTMVYYQLGSPLRENTYYLGQYLNLINVMINGYCTHELRSKACLGYQVNSNVVQMNDTCGLVISVVGHTYDTQYVEEQIDEFMSRIMNKMSCMPKNVFGNYKKQFLDMPTLTPLQIAPELFNSDSDWQEIMSKNYLFSRSHQAERDIITTAPLSEICKVLQEMIHPKTRRKLSVHIKSEINEPEREQRSIVREAIRKILPSYEQPKKIKNIALFKKIYARDLM